LHAYDIVYDLYADILRPALANARTHVTPEEMIDLPPLGATPTDAEWRAMSPAWDVAVETFAESGMRPQGARGGSNVDASTLPHAVRNISELDDRLFYRAQWLVRRALLERGQQLGVGRDIFYCDDPLSPDLDPRAVSAQALRNRVALAEAKLWHMPRAIRDGRALEEPWIHGHTWRGEGTGGVAFGTVWRLTHGDSPPPGTVLVAASVPPSALCAFDNLAALVSEFDGLLGHSAAMARELSIPCVVRCPGAWRDLENGDKVLVDGHLGVVIRLQTT
jgi:phosphohistidine swiveling domain-containing protein